MLSNALAHFPARNVRLGALEVTLTADRLTAIGSDGYTAGVDYCTARGQGEPAVMHIERSEAQALEAMLRRNKKAIASLQVSAEGLTVSAGSDDDMDILDVRFTFDADDRIRYQLIIDAIAAREGRDTVAMIDPALMGRFGKVKTVDGDRHADFRWDREGIDPMLVKVGPTFVGLIVPIDREVNAEANGTEGLWDDE